jgi:hypothetical protein
MKRDTYDKNLQFLSTVLETDPARVERKLTKLAKRNSFEKSRRRYSLSYRIFLIEEFMYGW